MANIRMKLYILAAKNYFPEQTIIIAKQLTERRPYCFLTA